MQGKFVNCGQTCIAPDYVLIPRDLRDTFVEHCKTVLKEFYSDNPQDSTSFSRIINEQHWQRLTTVLGQSRGHIAVGGKTDKQEKYIAPTLVVDVHADDALMKDEIFGPILPILDCETVKDAVAFIRNRYMMNTALFIYFI